jgi:hypothetical protein
MVLFSGLHHYEAPVKTDLKDLPHSRTRKTKRSIPNNYREPQTLNKQFDFNNKNEN